MNPMKKLEELKENATNLYEDPDVKLKDTPAIEKFWLGFMDQAFHLGKLAGAEGCVERVKAACTDEKQEQEAESNGYASARHDATDAAQSYLDEVRKEN